MPFDQTMLDMIRTWRTPELTAFFNAITFLGSKEAIAAISIGMIIMLLVARKKRVALYVAYFTIIDALITYMLKNLIHRIRPDEMGRLINETGFSLPSGHSSSSLLLYGMVAYLITRSIASRVGRIAVIIEMSILITLIGFSRMYLGVHYPTDVMFGFLIGGLLLWLFIRLAKRHNDGDTTPNS